jgi:LysM repeat protein
VPASGADEDLAELVSGRPPTDQAQSRPSPAPTTGRRPAVSSTRPPKDAIPGPAWERMRRYEAYPTIKTRTGLPGLPRVAVLAGALGIAALALFFLPALLGVGGGGAGPAGSAGASPIGSAAVATAIPSPTPVPAPTPQIYIIKSGDTLSKVAKKFGITLDALLAANKDTIKDPDKVSIGDPVTIPAPAPNDFTDASPTPSG